MKDLLTNAQAAAFLGRSPRRLWGYAMRFPILRRARRLCGRSWRWVPELLERHRDEEMPHYRATPRGWADTARSERGRFARRAS